MKPKGCGNKHGHGTWEDNNSLVMRASIGLVDPFSTSAGEPGEPGEEKRERERECHGADGVKGKRSRMGLNREGRGGRQ